MNSFKSTHYASNDNDVFSEWCAESDIKQVGEYSCPEGAL